MRDDRDICVGDLCRFRQTGNIVLIINEFKAENPRCDEIIDYFDIYYTAQCMFSSYWEKEHISRALDIIVSARV